MIDPAAVTQALGAPLSTRELHRRFARAAERIAKPIDTDAGQRERVRVRLRITCRVPVNTVAIADKEHDGSFTVRMLPGLPSTVALWVLAHELAHVVAWEWQSIEEDHGPHWGVAYSQMYQLLLYP